MEISQEFIFGAGLFGTVAVLAFALSGLVFRREDRVVQRLRRSQPEEAITATASPAPKASRSSADVVSPVVSRLSHAAAKPFMPKSALKQSNLRRDLSNAGIYSASAMELIVGMKVI